MEIKKLADVNGTEIVFVNNSRSTRHGFAHDTTMFMNNLEIVSNTCYYLNRTWESYRYQTVMLGAVQKLIDGRRWSLLRSFKDEFGVNRMTPARKEQFEKWIIADARLQEYHLIKKLLRGE